MSHVKKTKYIFVSGGVISGVGKGIATASIGMILKQRGLKVDFIKCDPYLNLDAGTMNPLEHGEVFVTEDGYEMDMDAGHYERRHEVRGVRTRDRYVPPTDDARFVEVLLEPDRGHVTEEEELLDVELRGDLHGHADVLRQAAGVVVGDKHGHERDPVDHQLKTTAPRTPDAGDGQRADDPGEESLAIKRKALHRALLEEVREVAQSGSEPDEKPGARAPLIALHSSRR